MTRIEILSQQLELLNTEKITAIGSRLRHINRRIEIIQNVLIRDDNYPPVSGSTTPLPTVEIRGEQGIRGEPGEKGEPGKDGQDIDPSILNGKLDFVQYATFQDLPLLPVITPILAIVEIDHTNDDGESVYLCFGPTRKLLVSVAG